MWRVNLAPLEASQDLNLLQAVETLQVKKVLRTY